MQNVFIAFAKQVGRVAKHVALGSALCAQSAITLALTSADFAAVPPTLRGSTPPLVMFAMSRDHQLYVKAYTDYSDITGDGVLDTSYVNTFDYYGYFNSNFCYNYDTTNNRYVPVQQATGTNKHTCGVSGARWSGNFLNWATMTRMDIVRAVLYGGARISGVDTATIGATAGVTVLERAFLPADDHAFVKVYTGADIANYTPYSSASISLCNTSLSSTGAPLIRVASGRWPLWASSEVTQCRYRDEGNSGLSDQPSFADQLTGSTTAALDLNARVQSCVAGVDAIAGNSRCKAYTHPTTAAVTYKPIGLLQQYGDDGRIRFGLTTGSYNRKIAGGVVRKNISTFSNNTVASNDEIDLSNGRINSGVTGIVSTLSDLRIVQYNFGSHNYTDCDTYSISVNTFMTSTAANRQCVNWGNPISEIYLESLRYFAGLSPTTAFSISDASQIATLPNLTTWQDPLSSSNACANCSLIVISTGLNSFDADDLGSAAGLPGISSVTDVQAKTNAVGANEGVNGNSFLIGRNGTTNDDTCTAKTLSNLSSASGVCPELPMLQGSYNIAGLAYHAHITDMRTSLSGRQKVNTYAVALSESLPSFEISVNGKTVSFVPTCQSNGGGSTLASTGWSDCSIVDVRVESQTTTTGSFLIAWEDSLWGSDYDMDGIARLEYCAGTNTAACPATPANSPAGTGVNAWANYAWKTTGLTADSVQFRISAPQANAGNALRFGYVISGVQTTATAISRVTNAAGAGGSVSFVPTNGVQSYLWRPSATNPISRISGNTGNEAVFVEPVVYTASSLITAGSLLENPLWYAAKYGNFNDLNSNNLPDSGEWDVQDINGRSTAQGGGPDGIPDNYFPVRNPANLVGSLQQVLQRISASVASSTAAAVVANSSRGVGAVYQAVYYPQFQKKNALGQVVQTVDWVGELHALFIDENGVLREDNPATGQGVRGQLDAITIDYGLDIYYDAQQNLTLVQRHSGYPFTSANRVGSVEAFEKIHPLWSARDNLAALTTAQLETQRSYTGSADTGRYIFTWIDRNKDGRVDNSATTTEVIPFEPASFPAAASVPGPTTSNQDNYRYLGLNVPTPAQITGVVNYVRGIDGGRRSRMIDYQGTGTDKPWILGDIITSSPTIVGAPDDGYDILYGDDTYRAYRQLYENRRQVAYVGGNDGMLHAFNAGKWQSTSKSFSAAGQPLGGELWAYVPFNLLPHVQWLGESTYPHVFYVDGATKAFDVNIFTPSAAHPGGWGTILVVGMRFGGGAFPLDTNGDGTNDTTATSAYVVLDVTDPETPPKLLAELTNTSLGFTVGEPVVVKRRMPTTGSYSGTTDNKWLLVAGSGPTDLTTATSTQNSRVFAWDISDSTNITAVNLKAGIGTGVAESNSFMGNPTVADWNNDFSDDVIYAGTVGGTVAAPTGKVKRIILDTSNWGLSTTQNASANTLFDATRPVTATPTVTTDPSSGDNWVLFGTGRFFVAADSQSTAQQAYYGIKEPRNTSGALSLATITTGIINVTDYHVSSLGNVLGAGGSAVSIGGTSISTFSDLRRKIAEGNGWVRYFDVPSGEAAERNYVDSTIYYTSILIPTYQPDGDLCSAAGDGRLYAVSMFAGTADPYAPLGAATTTVFPLTTNPEASPFVSIGRTPLSKVSVIPAGDDNKYFGQGGSGQPVSGLLKSPVPPAGRQSWREIEINFGL